MTMVMGMGMVHGDGDGDGCVSVLQFIFRNWFGKLRKCIRDISVLW